MNINLDDINEILDWLGRVTGVLVPLLALIGFMFREKWKQILQRSLASDLERLKSDLKKENELYAASLAPQLEFIKLGFQQQLEAYKVSLIAETEAAKARSELKKSIALRYSEIEFERLVELEAITSSIVSEIASRVNLSNELKDQQHMNYCIDKYNDFYAGNDRVEMFLEAAEIEHFRKLQPALFNLIQGHVTSNSPPPKQETINNLISLSETCNNILKEKIKALGVYPI